MFARLAADAVVVIHFAFILFVVFGGLAALRWRIAVVLHLPAAIWGALVEFTGWICPLTPLEKMLRRAAGQAGYEGGFIAHYLTPLIYPAGLTRTGQIGLGIAVVTLNLVIYSLVIRKHRKA